MAETQEQSIVAATANPTVIDQPQYTGLTPIASPQALLQNFDAINEVIVKCLRHETDYGRIPGTDRDTLLKPGAEKLCACFGLTAVYKIAEQEVDHNLECPYTRKNDPRQYTSIGLYRFVIECQLVSSKTGLVVGSGMGSCSTLEAKYVSRPRDCENTVLKMAQKRALIGACLASFALSDRFNQDMEEVMENAQAAKNPGSNDTINAASAYLCTVLECPPLKLAENKIFLEYKAACIDAKQSWARIAVEAESLDITRVPELYELARKHGVVLE